MFTFSNGADIETVFDVSKYTLNIWENDHALVYCIERKWLLFDGCSMELTNSCGRLLRLSDDRDRIHSPKQCFKPNTGQWIMSRNTIIVLSLVQNDYRCCLDW
jgi:hypothetical protein